MQRQLFVYWKTRRDAAEAAAAAAAAMQAKLRQAHPGVVAALYRRSDEGSETGSDEVTLMEVYRHAGGVDTSLQQAIESAAAQQLAAYLRGARHTEVFTAL
jgi:quinol monooxygenase YgiN